MVAREPTRKLTYEDYARTPEGERWELIDGELFMPPSPKEAHQSVQAALGTAMHNLLGLVAWEECICALRRGSVRP